MVTADALFRERARDLVAWSGGPGFVDVAGDGTILVTAPGQPPRRLGDPAALVFLGGHGRFVEVRLQDGEVSVTETSVDGSTDTWSVSGAVAATGSLLDVVEGVAADGAGSLAVTWEPPDGVPEILTVRRGGPLTRRPAPAHPLLYQDLRRDVVVTQQDRGPEDPVLHVRRCSTGNPVTTIAGIWRDGWQGTAVVQAAGAIEVWDLAAGARIRTLAVEGHLSDVRLLRPEARRLLVVHTVDGVDQVLLTDPTERLAVSAGRTRVCVAHATGVGLHTCSTLGPSAWTWVRPDGTTHTAPGTVPAYRGTASVTHQWLGGHTPALVYRPATPPTGLVIALHGGPEALERDELRWEGGYRWLLDQGIAVIGLNYSGSLGYGEAHRRRPWQDWGTAIREDIGACLALAARWGLDRGRIGLLGGSFGASLALLGLGMFPGLAGAVACSPLADLARHVARCTRLDRRYQAWFRQRFPDADHLFRPGTLTATGAARVVVIQGDADEVIELADVVSLVDRARAHGRPWRLIPEPGMGHRPASPDQAALRWRNLRTGLREVLPGRRGGGVPDHESGRQG